MTPPYVPLETIQLLSETSFFKIKNKKVIWGGTLKWDTLYNSCDGETYRIFGIYITGKNSLFGSKQFSALRN